jgi:hypothetical protein
MKLDKAVSFLAELGVPGLVLVVALSASGFVGAAAVTTALATLGGPLGMLGGIGVVGMLALASAEMSRVGSRRFIAAVVARLPQNGGTIGSILLRVKRYPISEELKRAVCDQLSV